MNQLSANDGNPEEAGTVPEIEVADVEGDVVEGANDNSAEREEEEEKLENVVTEDLDGEEFSAGLTAPIAEESVVQVIGNMHTPNCLTQLLACL